MVWSQTNLACMHDRPTANGAAIWIIKVISQIIVNIGCYCHTIDLVGEKFDLPLLGDFDRLWISLSLHI